MQESDHPVDFLTDKVVHTRISKMRQYSFLALLSIFSLAYILESTAYLLLPCTPCISEEECERQPFSLCLYGETRNACNRRVCAKGPDDFCGGPMNKYGECGEGLRCRSDGRCHGCHVDTMHCSES